MQFAKRLDSLMADRNLTKYRVAKMCEVSQTTVKNWLTGHSEPYQRDHAKIAAALNTTTLYLFNEPDERGQKEKPTVKDDGLTDFERTVLEAYRNNPDAKALIEFAVERYKEAHKKNPAD